MFFDAFCKNPSFIHESIAAYHKYINEATTTKIADAIICTFLISILPFYIPNVCKYTIDIQFQMRVINFSSDIKQNALTNKQNFIYRILFAFSFKPHLK